MKNVNQTTRMLCEGAVSIALAYALTFVELDLWFHQRKAYLQNQQSVQMRVC